MKPSDRIEEIYKFKKMRGLNGTSDVELKQEAIIQYLDEEEHRKK